MNEVIQKVTAFIVREKNGIRELLVFKHPTAGIQIPAGTVEEGEDIETAVKRETYEETGLQFVEIEDYLGCFENELEDNQRIIAETTQVYIEPNLSAIPYKRKLPKGLTVDYLSTQADFTHISYIEYEYDHFYEPICIDTNITGWVPNENISAQKKRHFFSFIHTRGNSGCMGIEKRSRTYFQAVLDSACAETPNYTATRQVVGFCLRENLNCGKIDMSRTR